MVDLLFGQEAHAFSLWSEQGWYKRKIKSKSPRISEGAGATELMLLQRNDDEVAERSYCDGE